MLTDPAATALAPAPTNTADRFTDRMLPLDCCKHAGVRVVVHARVDRRQEVRGGELPQRGGLQDPLAGDVQLGVLHVRQAQGRRQVDRPDLDAPRIDGGVGGGGTMSTAGFRPGRAPASAGRRAASGAGAADWAAAAAAGSLRPCRIRRRPSPSDPDGERIPRPPVGLIVLTCASTASARMRFRGPCIPVADHTSYRHPIAHLDRSPASRGPMPVDRTSRVGPDVDRRNGLDLHRECRPRHDSHDRSAECIARPFGPRDRADPRWSRGWCDSRYELDQVEPIRSSDETA